MLTEATSHEEEDVKHGVAICPVAFGDVLGQSVRRDILDDEKDIVSSRL